MTAPVNFPPGFDSALWEGWESNGHSLARWADQDTLFKIWFKKDGKLWAQYLDDNDRGTEWEGWNNHGFFNSQQEAIDALNESAEARGGWAKP